MDEFFVEDGPFNTAKFTKYNFAVHACKVLLSNVCMHGDVVGWAVTPTRSISEDTNLYFFDAGGGMLLRKDFFTRTGNIEVPVCGEQKTRKAVRKNPKRPRKKK